MLCFYTITLNMFGEEELSKEIFDPISGEWIPTEMTEEDVMQLMLRNEEMKAEQEIIRKKVFKTIGATAGWTQEEN